MDNNRFDEIKKIMEEPEVPESLSPESMKKALDEMQQAKKRRSIERTGWMKWGAGAAACAVLLGTGSYAAKQIAENSVSPDAISGSYMTCASDYKEVYAYMEKYRDEIVYYCEAYAEEELTYDEAATEAAVDGSINSGAGEYTVTTSTSSEKEISELHNQEDGVLEGDIVRTDGRYIFSAISNDSSFIIHAAETDNGTFTNSFDIDLSEYLPESVVSGSKEAMYLIDGRLTVIFRADEKYSGDHKWYCRTYVMTFEAGDEITYLGSYSQDGYFSDVRLMEDGTLYLITDYTWTRAFDKDNFYDCIPEYSTSGETVTALPEDILLPGTCLVMDDNIEFDFSETFTNIGSVNVLSDTPDAVIDFKSLAGFSGEMYCSLSNIYLACAKSPVSGIMSSNQAGFTTDFTRISIENGIIEPQAGVNVAGTVNDQFSMSEYGGYFRAALTRRNYFVDDGITEAVNDNALYVFDLDLNQVGIAEGFGEDESIKSASFQGDLAYVVTYLQTDPLYSFDLSDPYNPVILDEHKITGYSSYMQQWSEGQLLGFGTDADESGRQLGYKLVMFDNSDPADLSEIDIQTLHFDDVCDAAGDGYYFKNMSSNALSERKALLIAPEKELIAVPFNYDSIIKSGEENEYLFGYGYALYSFANGEFSERDIVYGRNFLDRALYINDTIYLVGADEMIAVDMASMEENDRIMF